MTVTTHHRPPVTNPETTVRPDTAASPVPRPVVGTRTLYIDGRGHLWITSDTGADRIRALTPENAPPRWDTPAGVEHTTGTCAELRKGVR
ncbi:hypothetical protein [Streptomyces sp. SID3343]|uniref:hypothetical protein n=1 Tax=Streptomyces sp. SID3343 TaxID=2690260 RepID=UPI0013703314|nr:hypothetical protein [Streptomyces sp. SID3343]MYW06047.1 hypothetical protein [Streptomyces sp. SID3343]